MKDLFVSFDHLLPRSLQYENDATRDLARVYVLIFISVIPLFLLFDFYYFFLDAKDLSLYCGLGTLIAMASYLVLALFGRPFWAGHVLTFGSWFYLVIASYFAGGISAPGVMWFTAAQLLTSLLFNDRWQYLWGVLFLIGAGALGVMDLAEQTIPSEISQKVMIGAKLFSIIGSSIIVMISSITYKRAQKSLLRSLDEKNRLLKDALEENTRLIRVLSHDISNSLVVVGVSTRQLLSEKAKSGQLDTQAVVERIQRATGNIRSLIEHVKEQQALISGRKDLILEPTQVETILKESLLLVEPLLEGKNISIESTHLGPMMNQRVMTEPISCSQIVLANILSNAIKFSDPGSTVHIECSERRPGFLELVIRDEGVGIPQEIKDNLFEFGHRTSRAGTEGESGTGFGMPLVKAYMMKYGGSIEVFSQERSDSNSASGTSVILSFRKA